jgi:NAD(P)H dehydrogenase (quinone)
MFVILGATGKVGRATIAKLRAQQAPVKAVVRVSSDAADLKTLGCEIAIADLHDSTAVAKAIEGANAVQIICPVSARAKHAASEMAGIIDAIAGTLIARPPETVLAISDYGAHVESGTGITMTFRYLEARLSEVPSSVIFLRSAEHMQNWARVIGSALETGVLPSFHHPVSKMFPTISAPDLGPISAELLLRKPNEVRPRVIHAEGPRRYSALEVAATLSEISGREIVARELPELEWIPTLTQAGISEMATNNCRRRNPLDPPPQSLRRDRANTRNAASSAVVR